MPKPDSQTSLVDDLFPEIEAGKYLIDTVRNPPPWLQSLPAKTADILFGDEWAAERKAAEATPAWSKERWILGATTVLPFLAMGGKLGEDIGNLPGLPARPRVPVLSPEEMLPPETAKLLGAVRAYNPEPPSPPSGDPMTYLHRHPDTAFLRPEMEINNWNYAPRPGSGPPPPRTSPGDVFNWEALPFAEKPPPPAPSPGPPPEMMIPLEGSPEWLQNEDAWNQMWKGYLADPDARISPESLQGHTYYSPQEIENIHALGLNPPPRSTPEIQQDWHHFINEYMSGKGQSGDTHQLPGGLHFGAQEEPRWYAHDYDVEFPPNTPKEGRFMSNQQPGPPPEDFDFTQYMQAGGVAGDVSLEDPPVSIFPDYSYLPDPGLYVDQIPPSPEFPTRVPEEPLIDSRDFIGAANYYYVDPKAQAQMSPPGGNYYGAVDQYRTVRSAPLDLARDIGGSLPPATASSPQEQVAMLNQWASMQEAARRFDSEERRKRLLQERWEAESRFGPQIEF